MGVALVAEPLARADGDSLDFAVRSVIEDDVGAPGTLFGAAAIPAGRGSGVIGGAVFASDLHPLSIADPRL